MVIAHLFACVFPCSALALPQSWEVTFTWIFLSAASRHYKGEHLHSSIETNKKTSFSFLVLSIKCWQHHKFEKIKLSNKIKLIITGGGRKNKFLVERLKKKINCEINSIEKYNLDGDFIESQAFAFLAIRSFINQPISYKWMTGCKKMNVKAESY